MTHLFDLLLCLMLIAVAGGAIGSREPFAAVALFVVYGLLLSIAWVRLEAVDVALAEVAIGAGLTGILLLGALGRVRGAQAQVRRSAPLTMLLCLGAAAALGWAVHDLARREIGLWALVQDSLTASGVANPVTAVLLNFRGWDTLLETIVLVAALMGVWTLAPDGDRPGRPRLRREREADDVLSTFGRFLAPIGLVVAAYLVWTGTKAPGGAFQAGTVLAAVWLLTIMAGLSRAPDTCGLRLRLAIVAGPLAYLLVGVAGLAAASFLSFPPRHAKALTVAVELMLMLSIAATLAMLVLGRPRRAR